MDRLEQYAIENKIPIMQKDGILFLIDYIKKNNVKKILEIGSAIGYSSINMALISKDINITTIERNEVMYKEALKNINDFNLEKQINVILGDALDVHIDKKFDLIFIDGAKGKYIDFFKKYKNNLNSRGTIITDNINFHGLTNNIDVIKTRRLRSLVRKINKYKNFLINNTEFDTIFIDIGDGIAVTKKII